MSGWRGSAGQVRRNFTQVDGLLAGKLGVTEAASALQIAARFPDDGGADEVVAIGEQILGPTDVSLSNWTVRPSSGCSVILATHAGVSVDGYTLTLAANPWNIVRTYNLTPGRELLFACRYRLGTASNFVVHMSEADNVYDPLYGSFVGDQCLEHGQDVLHRAAQRRLRGALPGAGPAQPNGRNSGRLRPPDPGRNPGGRQHGGGGRGGLGAAAEARVPRRRGRRRHAGHPGLTSLEMQPHACTQPHACSHTPARHTPARRVFILQPHACTQRFRLRILRRTRSNAGRTSARSLSGRI